MRAQAGGGTLTGSGTLDLDAPRAFALAARATRFNPARFVAMPEAQLDGTLAARGTLSAPFAVNADVSIAKGSRFAGLDVTGTARGDFTPATAKQLAVDLALGASTIALKGGYGTSADTLAYDVNIPRLAQLRPLALRYAKVAIPDPLAGSLRARGTVAGDPASPGVTVDARATSLEWGRTIQVATLDAAGSIGAGRGPEGPIPLSARPVTLDVAATRIVLAQGTLATAKAAVDGTLARHQGTLAATSPDFDLSMSVTGGLADVKRANGAIETAWTGSVDKLVNRGIYALSLTGPANVTIARDRLDVADAHVAIADGRVDIASLAFDEGRLSSRARSRVCR